MKFIFSRIIKILAGLSLAAMIVYILIQDVPLKGILDAGDTRIRKNQDYSLKFENREGPSGSQTEGGNTTEDESNDGQGSGNNGLPDITSDEEADSTISPDPGSDMEITEERSRLFMSSEEVESIACLSLKDKLTGMSILGRIRKEDMDSIYRMADDGVTYKEVAEIRAMLEKYLPESDVDTLYAILWKTKLLHKEKE